jgi:hypothetical protein
LQKELEIGGIYDRIDRATRDMGSPAKNSTGLHLSDDTLCSSTTHRAADLLLNRERETHEAELGVEGRHELLGEEIVTGLEEEAQEGIGEEVLGRDWRPARRERQRNLMRRRADERRRKQAAATGGGAVGIDLGAAAATG